MDQSDSHRRLLPADALDYAHDQFWMARGLGPHLDGLLAPSTWSAWTVADPSVPMSRLVRFSEGGSIASDSVEHHLYAAVAKAMTHVVAAWLVPDPLARPDDRFLMDVEVEYHGLDDAVYYVGRTAETERLAAVWRQAGSAAGQIEIVTTHALPASELDTDDLRSAAARAVLIVMSAYDGDGVLFLEKTEG
jgi:hypothetical protein